MMKNLKKLKINYLTFQKKCNIIYIENEAKEKILAALKNKKLI